jgi:TetR/AcrR family transcriptional repressor of nem operon
MRTSLNEKEKTHRRIVDGAARLMRERGLAATSVADVMSAAGLTHGGFYRHFDGKEALMLAALEAAFAERLATLRQRFAEQAPADAVASYRAHYLQEGHVGAVGIGCPVPTLAGEVARAPQALKAAFGANIRQTIGLLAQGMAGPPEAREGLAAREIAMLAGAILLARASDPETGALILEACRERQSSPDNPNLPGG